MAEGTRTARFVLGVQASLPRVVRASLHLTGLASMMLLTLQMKSWSANARH